MQHDRLKLVVSDDDAQAVTDGSAKLRAVPASPDSSVRRLRLVDADEGARPDDAA